MSTHAEPNVYDDAKSAEVTKQHRDDRRNFGAITVALAAEESGATIRWLTPRSFWAILDDRRIPISSYYGAESALAWSIERDKILAKDFWASQGVSVPPGAPSRLAEGRSPSPNRDRGTCCLETHHGIGRDWCYCQCKRTD